MNGIAATNMCLTWQGKMLTAARTAPKGKGIDVIEAALVTGEDIKKLSGKDGRYG